MRVLATRLEATVLAAFVARLWRVIRAALRRRRCTMSSISAAICRARFSESPISLAVSSMDGTGAVIRTLRGMAPRYEAKHRVSILERLFSHSFGPHRCSGSVNGGIGYRVSRSAPMPKEGYTRLIRQDGSRSAGNLTDRVRVENEARHSGVDRAQPSPRLTQQGIELVPPLLAAVIGLRGKPPQPSQERKVFALDGSPPCRSRRWSIGHRLPRW